MASSTDTEITLGTGKLLFMFFFLVAVCSLFFALGYSLGRKSDVGFSTATAAPPLQTSPSSGKPQGGESANQPTSSLYKSVEQKDVTSDSAVPAAQSRPDASGNSGARSQGAEANAAPALGGYFVQVAAVSKPDDAQALVDALKKKQYPAFVASVAANDKLFRVQLGPFGDVKEAESLRTRLVNDGYNPILKK